MGLDESTLLSIDRYAEALIAAGATPGIALALTDRERPLAIRCYGQADPAAGQPVGAETLFQIGSISKSFTAICLLREAERGRLDLHAPVSAVLPWFPLEGITAHHLLSHTGGLIMGLEGLGPYEVAALGETATAPAGERFWYSNLGYQALGYVLERVTGEPYADTYRRRILAPLEMHDTLAVIRNEIRPRLAVGHAPLHDDRPWSPGDPLAPAAWVEYTIADGSVCSTAGDLSRYGRMLLNHGQGVLPAEGFRLLTRPVVEDPEELGWYGYGIGLREVAGRSWIGHSGGMIGFHARLWCDMDAGLAVAVLVNGKSGHHELADYALRLAAGDAAEPPPIESLADPAPATMDADCPDRWRALCGLYRSGNPWCPTVRVGTVGGVLTAIVDGEGHRLHHLGDGRYRLGDQPWCPERIRFDTVVEGRALRAWLNLTRFLRVSL